MILHSLQLTNIEPLFLFLAVLALSGQKFEGGFTPGWAIVSVLASFNHPVNFFLYLISGQQFRKQFMEIICCKKSEDNSMNTSRSGTRTNSTHY